jgi:hypothetical protein
MEIQKVIQMIQDLCRKTVRNGCTESEAMSAAEKIGDLMKVYNLSMDRVFLGETNCVQESIPTDRLRRHPIDGCVVGIAEFCDCHVWYNKGYQRNNYYVFGLPPDVEMMKYLYNMIMSAMDTSLAAYKLSDLYIAGKNEYGYKVSKKSLSNSFQKGMAGRISHRLGVMTRSRHAEEEVMPIPSTGTSLVLVKQNKVRQEFEGLGIRLRKAHQSWHHPDQSAYKQGQAAGESVNLSRPMGGKVVGLLQ